MRLIDIVMMALIPLSIGAALLIAAIGGRMPAGARAGIHRTLIAVVYSSSTVFFGWQALIAFGEAERIRSGIYAVAAVIMAAGGLKLLLRHLSSDNREPAK